MIFKDLQSLDSGKSKYIELFELEIDDNVFIYFTNYTITTGPDEENGTGANLLQCRDYEVPATIRTYVPLPARLEGVEFKTQGPLPQPTLTIANVLRMAASHPDLQSMISGISYDNLLGRRIIRRRTLEKYLYNYDVSSPTVELPRDVYYLDRIEQETPQDVTFVTVSPTDLTNITLPRRTIIANACPWKYKGSAFNLDPWLRSGGCVWPTDNSIDRTGTSYSVYVNQDDEYIFDAAAVSPIAYVGSATIDLLYRTTQGGLEKVQPNGNISFSVSFLAGNVSGGNITIANGFITGDMVLHSAGSGTGLGIGSAYFVRIVSGSTFSLHTTRAGALANTGRVTVSGGFGTISPAAYSYWVSYDGADVTPSETSVSWRRARLYETYAAAQFIEVFTIDRYNTYSISGTSVWKAVSYSRSPNLHTAPAYGALWERGDRCGKGLRSCSMRFGSVQAGAIISATQNTAVVLPFGAFPTARNFG